MSLIPAEFDPSKLRIGVADKLSDSYAAPAAASAPDDGVDPAYRAKATEAAVKFESFFIGHMLHQMRDGTRAMAADDSPTKDRINQDMLDMADNLVADQLAGKRAFGVADAILRQLLPLNASATAPSPDMARRTAETNAMLAASGENIAGSQNLSETLNRSR
jgi:flagellar protein FlgJ